jgi:hypothetical protein
MNLHGWSKLRSGKGQPPDSAGFGMLPKRTQQLKTMIHHYLIQKMRFVVVFMAVFLATGVVSADEELTVPELIERMQAFKQRFEKNSDWLIEYTHNVEYRAVPPELKAQ